MVRRRKRSKPKALFTPITAAEWTPEIHAERVEVAVQMLKPRMPHIKPRVLRRIVNTMLRPFGTGRRFFIRRGPDGRFRSPS